MAFMIVTPPFPPWVDTAETLALRMERTIVGGNFFLFGANGELCAPTVRPDDGQSARNHGRAMCRRSSRYWSGAEQDGTTVLVADCPTDGIVAHLQPSKPATGRTFEPARNPVLLGWV